MPDQPNTKPPVSDERGQCWTIPVSVCTGCGGILGFKLRRDGRCTCDPACAKTGKQIAVVPAAQAEQLEANWAGTRDRLDAEAEKAEAAEARADRAEAILTALVGGVAVRAGAMKALPEAFPAPPAGQAPDWLDEDVGWAEQLMSAALEAALAAAKKQVETQYERSIS